MAVMGPVPGHQAPSLPQVPPTTTREDTYYLDLAVFANLVYLDLLGIGQGIMQGLWWWLELAGRWRCAQNRLCMGGGWVSMVRGQDPFPRCSAKALGGR